MSTPFRVRLSDAMARALTEVAPGNSSAALKALVLIGLDAAGYAIADLELERCRLLAEPLSPLVMQAIKALECRTGVGHLSYTSPATEEQVEQERVVGDSDPFAAIGIEV